MSETLRCHDAARLLTNAISVARRIARLNKEKEEERLGGTLEEHCQFVMFRAASDRFESSLRHALNSVLDELGGTAVEVDLVHVQSLKKENCCILAQVELEKWKLKNLKQKIAELEHHSIEEAVGDEHESDVIEDDASNGLSTLEDDVVSTGDYEDSYSVKAVVCGQDNAADIGIAKYADHDEESEIL